MNKSHIIDEFLARARVCSSDVHDLVDQRLREELGEGITRAQVQVLLLVQGSGPRTVGQVADFLGVSNPAASKSVARLVRRGLVGRNASSRDRRAASIALTPSGQALLARYADIRDATLRRLFHEVSSEDLTQLTFALDRVSHALHHSGESGPGSRPRGERIHG